MSALLTGEPVKLRTLFRLGALATFVTALGYAIGEAMYLFGNVQTLFFAWYAIIIYTFQAFAYIALYGVQIKRGDLFLLIGFVLSIIATLYTFMDAERRLALRTALVTQAQLDQAQQIRSFTILSAIGENSIILGWIVFGFGIIRTGIFPRALGVIMMLTGLLIIVRDSALVFEVAFAILSFIAFAWLGWALWQQADEGMATP